VQKKIHRFENGVCIKCRTREMFINFIVKNHRDPHIWQLIKEHPEKREELISSAFPCKMTDDEWIIKDIIE